MPPEVPALLANLGVPTLVLAWFMWVWGPRLDRIDRTLDRFNRVTLLHLLSRPVPRVNREQADALLQEIDEEKSGSSGPPFRGRG